MLLFGRFLKTVHGMSRKPENTSSKPGAIAVAGYKTSLRVFAGKLEIKQGETVEYIQPGRFRAPRCIILLHPNGFMTFDAMTWLAQNGIPMISVNWQDETTNILMSDCSVGEALYNKELVETQLALARDPAQALAISKRLISAKIHNSVNTLHDLGAPATAVSNCQTQVMRARNHSELLGAEGKAALAYFTQWRNLPLQWKPNKRRPIPDDWHF